VSRQKPKEELRIWWSVLGQFYRLRIQDIGVLKWVDLLNTSCKSVKYINSLTYVPYV
jgi:hypothetical protein